MSSFVDSAEFELLLERIAADDDTSLTGVDLIRRGIGDAGAVRLAVALQGNSHVAYIWLSQNNIGDDGAAALAEALRGNSTLTELSMWGNSIGDEGGRAFLELLQVNSTITVLWLWGNDTDEDLEEKIQELVDINRNAPNPEEARRLKIEFRIRWLLDSEGNGDEDETESECGDSEGSGEEEATEDDTGAEYEAAVSLALAELGSFPVAERRRGLFHHLLGSKERGAAVAASVDAATGGTLYRYAAECGPAPVVLTNLLRAHPSLCVCRDVRTKLFPFMLLATMEEAEMGDVMDALLANPSLVEGGNGGPAE